jgi:hypothetical protein
VISGILDIKNTKVRKKRLLVKGKNNSLKIYLLIILIDVAPLLSPKQYTRPLPSPHMPYSGRGEKTDLLSEKQPFYSAFQPVCRA